MSTDIRWLPCIQRSHGADTIKGVAVPAGQRVLCDVLIHNVTSTLETSKNIWLVAKSGRNLPVSKGTQK